MIPNDHPSLFVAFEGLDGSGSKTQASLLANVLEKEGYRVVLTREPTNSLFGGLIRAHLTGNWKAVPEALHLLFAADRAQHLDEQIIPALEAGKIVITDRYAMSTIAYGSLEISDSAWLEGINRRFIAPDITFLIQVRPKICALRLKEQRYEVELYNEEKKLTKVWKAYQQAAEHMENVQIINGERAELEIVEELKAAVKERLTYGKEKKTRPNLDNESVNS